MYTIPSKLTLNPYYEYQLEFNMSTVWAYPALFGIGSGAPFIAYWLKLKLHLFDLLRICCTSLPACLTAFSLKFWLT